MTSNTSTHAITGSALGKVLVDRGLLDEPQLLYAMQKRAVENQLMGRLLIQNGLADETEVVRALAELNGLQFVNLDNLPEADPQVLAIFNREICLAQNFLPLRVMTQ